MTSHAPATALPARTRWHGARQILSYNRAKYAAAAAAATLLLVVGHVVQWPWPLLAWAAALALALGSLLSVVASHALYDRSPLHSWNWLAPRVPAVRAWAVVHAGLDEASVPLGALYPDATANTWDIFDPQRMTEPAIRVARALHGEASTRVAFSRLPAPAASLDLVMLFFAAHELRTHGDRVTLLRECRRVVARGGRIVVAEHMRNAANLAAFGPGAFHFYPQATWLRAFSEAGLMVADTVPFAHLARIYFLEGKA